MKKQNEIDVCSCNAENCEEVQSYTFSETKAKLDWKFILFVSPFKTKCLPEKYNVEISTLHQFNKSAWIL